MRLSLLGSMSFGIRMCDFWSVIYLRKVFEECILSGLAAILA
jgi:hypothetical protein